MRTSSGVAAARCSPTGNPRATLAPPQVDPCLRPLRPGGTGSAAWALVHATRVDTADWPVPRDRRRGGACRLDAVESAAGTPPWWKTACSLAQRSSTAFRARQFDQIVGPLPQSGRPLGCAVFRHASSAYPREPRASKTLKAIRSPEERAVATCPRRFHAGDIISPYQRAIAGGRLAPRSVEAPAGAGQTSSGRSLGKQLIGGE